MHLPPSSDIHRDPVEMLVIEIQESKKKKCCLDLGFVTLID